MATTILPDDVLKANTSVYVYKDTKCGIAISYLHSDYYRYEWKSVDNVSVLAFVFQSCSPDYESLKAALKPYGKEITLCKDKR